MLLIVLFCSASESDDDDGLPPDPVGISRVSDALQAHMWPIMEEAEGKKAGGQSTKAAGGGDDGGTEDKEEKGVAKKDLSKLEAEVAGSLAVSREEAKKRVGKMVVEMDVDRVEVLVCLSRTPL